MATMKVEGADGKNVIAETAPVVITWKPELLAISGNAQWLVVDVPHSELRAQLLQSGYGDAAGPDCHTAEISARLARLSGSSDHRRKLVLKMGGMALDRLEKAACWNNTPVVLHQREFDLFWHLMEANGNICTQMELMRKVCRIAFDPGTNRIAVHVFRLRKSLKAVGVQNAVETVANGYRINNNAFSTSANGDDISGLDAFDTIGKPAEPRLRINHHASA